jgi:hypothetical protein
VTVYTILSSADVTALAHGILDPERPMPWCVVSIPADAAEPLFDLADLDEQVGDVCRIHLVKTGPLTHQLDALLPDRCQVYGGAGRVYPVDGGWHSRPQDAPLRFIHSPQRAAAATDTLVADALSMAHAAGLFLRQVPASIRVAGTVKRLLANDTRAVVQLTSGEFATVQHELVFPQIPLPWVVSEGQEVTGTVDPASRRLSLDVVSPTAEDILSAYPHGAVTLALVESVERQRATLAVHPTIPVEVRRVDVSSNPLDRVDLLLAAGDVVRARVLRNEQGRLRLTLLDVDDDDPVVDSLPLLRGGTPWLVEGRELAVGGQPEAFPDEPLRDERLAVDPLPRAVESVQIPVAPPVPRPGPGLRAPAAAPERGPVLQSLLVQLDESRAAEAQLRAQLRNQAGADAASLRLELGQVLAENARLRDDLRIVRTDQQAQRALLRRARQSGNSDGYAERRARFDDQTDWVRHEIQLAWVERLEPADRRNWPLPGDYAVGERFAASLADLDDTYLSKAFKAVVDVLTGRVREITSRRVHPLRQGDGGAAADLVRPDGARCMRASIEQGTSSARRLHYWVGPGTLELSRVVLHDDMEP